MNKNMKKGISIKRKLAAAALLIVMLVSVLCPAALASFTATINSSSARVYQYPTTSARSYSNFKGLTVTVTAYQNGWARITRGSNVGFIPVKDLNLTTAIPGWTKRPTTVYSAPYRPMGTAPKGTPVYVFGYYSGYCRVASVNGNVGYIKMNDLSRSYVAPDAPAPTPSHGGSTGDSRLDKVLSAAYSALGKPYAEQADPPRSFDCSTFCRWCYAAGGESVGQNAYEQGYSDKYPKITSLSDIRVGDMLCFNTNEDDDDLSDHTAIYIGNGQFVHASSNKLAVIVSDFNDYYVEHFSWARRVIG